MYYSGIIDTHAHYDDERFSGQLPLILSGQREHGVEAVISCGSSLETSLRNIEISEQFDFVYATAGVHPSDAGDLPADWLGRLRGMALHPRVVAIGEIGLDYHYPSPSREIQRSVFEQQLALAHELGMPVQIHDREAHRDVFDLVSAYRPTGCMHRCSVSVEMARDYIRLGLYLGFGGALTYDNMKREREVVRDIPLDRLLLETDCPYLTPVQYRGRISTSDMLWTVADLISEIRGDASPQQIVNISAENARNVFHLDPGTKT